MIIVECEQNTTDWFAARLGIPTASRFGDIITPKGTLSKSSVPYLYELAAEWLTGKPKPSFISDAMVNGFLMQPEAVEYYEMRRSVDADPVGFCLDDGERYGCSPDALVGEPGQLEIKCPQQHTHMSVLMTGQMPAKHKPQVQGQLLVTGREWCDFVSYHPEMPGEIIRVKRDEAYIEALRDALEGFCDLLDQSKAQLQKRGFEPVDCQQEKGTGDEPTQEDVGPVPKEDGHDDAGYDKAQKQEPQPRGEAAQGLLDRLDAT